MARVAIIGDVHGCSRTLAALLKKLPPRDRLLGVGDLIDRGPDSPGVLRLVREWDVECVMGNHEWLMITGHDPRSPHHDTWMMNGGQETRAQFGSRERCADVAEELRRLPLYLELEEADGRRVIVCHAGVKKGLTLAESIGHLHSPRGDEVMNSILWVRGKIGLPGALLVCGHTPVSRPVVTEDYINLDTGCVFRNKLTALLLPERELISVPCED